MGEKLKFRATVTQFVEIEFDSDLIPNDEWRRQFYNSIKTSRELAEHFAYNYAINDISRLSQLHGFANLPNKLMHVKKYDGAEVDAWEVAELRP